MKSNEDRYKNRRKEIEKAMRNSKCGIGYHPTELSLLIKDLFIRLKGEKL